ncbi:uncharacterized protein BX663DRAFT_247510 [Cokeromyces recurvatus]|uniref:uncharacterized protein n=1 Tax=Cokeromyces recurvatus TaxID=90255 RepID=UPI00222015B2|nr:uncharacterized protein BX663DRAFT_247510 [Cokeromyces recurvatus]KAI7905980.1 hypothetical protein BX663DRAFT_247510 [Cokeromyces recurvatus]
MANVVNKSPSMTHSEATFNYKMLHPCLEATVDLLGHEIHPEPYYVPGEEPLEAMIEQLVLTGSKVDRRKVYNADGIIRLRDFYDIEVLLLETAGHFQNKETRKICFDNSKGMFALLAMLKSTADRFSRATLETFRNLKFYFVQASDEHIRLWSAQYASNGIYKFALEDKVEVTEDRQQVQQSSVSLLDFFFNVKTCLAKTFTVLQKLQREDEENNVVSSQEVLLPEIICPEIFRLAYNTHGKGFGT